MRNETAWSHFEYTKEPIGTGPEASYKYAIPYSWGALHVTEEADESYGFVPLTADVQDHADIDFKKLDDTYPLRADIYLLSRQQVEQSQETEQKAGKSYGFVGNGFRATTFHKNGVEIRLALSQSSEDVKEQIINQATEFANRFGADVSEIMKDDIPLAEAVHQDSPQLLLNSFLSLTNGAAMEAGEEFVLVDRDKYLLDRPSFIVALGYIASGSVLGLRELEYHNINLPSMGIALAYTGLSTLLARRIIKDNLRASSQIRSIARNFGVAYGQTIASDMYKTFSTHHFDNETMSHLDNET